jgi:hypothetical protein
VSSFNRRGSLLGRSSVTNKAKDEKFTVEDALNVERRYGMTPDYSNLNWQGLEMPDLDMAGQAGDLDLGGLDM